MRVGDLAHQPCRRLHHVLEIRQHALAIHIGRHILHRDVVARAIHRQLQQFLVSHQNGRIEEDIEIGGGECICSVRDAVEAGGDAVPALRRPEFHRYRPCKLAGLVDEQSRRRKQGARLIEKVLYGKGDRSQHVVV